VANTRKHRQLRIDPLTVANAHQLLDSLLGNDPTVGPLKALLVQRIEGTPFFLEEGVRTLVETKVLLGDRGSYRLLKSVDAIEVPGTVKALLAARIDRLSPEEKAVLQAASVVGTDVPFEVLQAIVDIPPAELRRRLTQLQAAEFLSSPMRYPSSASSTSSGERSRRSTSSRPRRSSLRRRTAWHSGWRLDGFSRHGSMPSGEMAQRESLSSEAQWMNTARKGTISGCHAFSLCPRQRT
jgi:adenylate cyclase